MSEAEPSVEDILDDAAAQRAQDAGLEAPAKVEDKGESAKPKSGGDAPEAGDESKDEGEKLDAAETDDDQDDVSDDGEDGDKPKAKPQSRAQKRIRQLTRERDRTKDLLAQREAELAAFARMANEVQGTKPEPTATADDQPPKQEDYAGDFVAYNAAVAQWSAKQAVKEALDGFQKENQAKAQEARQEAKAADNTAKVREYFAKGAEKYDDFDDVKADYFEATDTMVHAVLESDVPEDLHYHFAKNPEDAARIAKLSPIAQVREITKLEAKVGRASPDGESDGEPDPTPKPKPVSKKQTSAPEPMKPVKAGGAPNSKDPDKVSMKDYMADHNARVRRGEISA